MNYFFWLFHFYFYLKGYQIAFHMRLLLVFIDDIEIHTMLRFDMAKNNIVGEVHRCFKRGSHLQ